MDNQNENTVGGEFSENFKERFPEFQEQVNKRFEDLRNLRSEFIDGQEVKVSGFPNEYKKFNHEQGDNPFEFKGTCGLVSCEGILKQYGIDVPEVDVVAHAIANDLCNVTDIPDQSGGTSAHTQAEILKDFGVDANVALMADLGSMSDILASGRSIIAEVNAGVLWDSRSAYGNGYSNHAIVVTGCARDADTSAIKGFYINDSGRSDLAANSMRFISAEKMEKCFLEKGGVSVITMDKHPLPIMV